MKGIIATNDPSIVPILIEAFKDWVVVLSDIKVLIEWYPIPDLTNKK